MKMKKIIFICFVTLICSSAISKISAQTKAEREVSVAFEKYFDARKAQDWDNVADMESYSGTYNTNSDGSFHKPFSKTSADQWKASGQSGTLDTYYPEFSEISTGVVYVRFYYEGIAANGSQSQDYRTRVTQNWIKENGDWVLKTQHYSPAQYGGVHITNSSDFDN
jgi:ketosteroid isomerase-like protein